MVNCIEEDKSNVYSIAMPSHGKVKPPKQIVTDGPMIRGINGLAQFLKCSTGSAQKLKKHLPHFQEGRIIFFNPAEVLNALDHPKTEAV